MIIASLQAALATATLLGSGAASAAPITYAVDQTIGTGTVTGTIETDGTIGVLNASDIVAFNLNLNSRGASFNLTNMNSSAFVSGSDLTATVTDLLFNYNPGETGYLLFEVAFGSGRTYYCNAASYATCYQGATVVPEAYNSPSAQNEPRSGTQIIASVAAVPEAASWIPLMLGLGALGATLGGRRK